jgi:hypothetical protein
MAGADGFLEDLEAPESEMPHELVVVLGERGFSLAQP